MVSVVVLTTLEKLPKHLSDCLDRQTYKDFEVIIANEKGIVNAMNKALEKANGEIFVRIDDDVYLPDMWLENLVEPFRYSNIAGATGPTFIPKDRRRNRDSIRLAENPKGILRWLYDGNEFNPGGIRKCGCVSYDSNYAERFGDVRWMNMNVDHLEGTNWAMRTGLIKLVRGFDPKFDGVAEWYDTDVEFKAKKLGYRLAYNSEAELYHMIEPSSDHYAERFDGFGRIKNFLRFHWRHGRHRFLNVKFYVYLIVWFCYFVGKRFKCL